MEPGPEEVKRRARARRAARWLADRGGELDHIQGAAEAASFQGDFCRLVSTRAVELHGLRCPADDRGEPTLTPSATIGSSAAALSESRNCLAGGSTYAFRASDILPPHPARRARHDVAWAGRTVLGEFSTGGGPVHGHVTASPALAILDVDHPDIQNFVECRAVEERQPWRLMEAGQSSERAYGGIELQGLANGVLVSDAFMADAVSERTCGGPPAREEPAGSGGARGLLGELAAAAHVCGFPGIHFTDALNAWHTCPAGGRVCASALGEFIFLEGTAAVGGTINLCAFYKSGTVDIGRLLAAVGCMVTAMEIGVDLAGHASEDIAVKSQKYRPLSLGMANLGALVMGCGLAYESGAALSFSAGLAALVLGEACRHSALMASRLGPCDGYSGNEASMLEVLERHREHVVQIRWLLVPGEMKQRVLRLWDEVLPLARRFGLRHAQLTAIGPGFLGDANITDGAEPHLSLASNWRRDGRSGLEFISPAVPKALRCLGYAEDEVSRVLNHVIATGTVEGVPGLRKEHLDVFTCACRPVNGERSISLEGHLKMAAALQPLLSGGISKVFNLGADASEASVEELLIRAWRAGLKSVFVFRERLLGPQPLTACGRPKT